MLDANETTSKEEIGETKNSSIVYIVSAILLIIVVAGGIYFMNKSESKVSASQTQNSPASPRPQRPSLKGQKLSDTKFADSAYQIYPGTVSEAAKAVMSGWDLKTTKNADGTVTAVLVPIGSEVTEGDTSHTYTLQSTDKLYFADINPGDDAPGATDSNKNDDMGIVVDSAGIIQ